MKDCVKYCRAESWAVFGCLEDARTCELVNECLDP
jgi:hypothetical protein